MGNDGFGLIDLLGRQVHPCQYDILSEPHCGLMYCRRKLAEPLDEYIDLSGKTVIALGPNRSGSPFNPVTGLARVSETRDGKNHYGFIDTAGRQVVPPIFADARYPAEGLLLFGSHEKPDLYGFADLTGKVVIPPRFNFRSESFSCGLALVSYPDNEAEYYFIDHAGKHVFGPVMKTANDFSDVFKEHGVVLLYEAKTHRQYIMDRSGRTLLKAPPGVALSRIREGLVQANDERTKKFGFLDLTGRWVVEPKYDSVRGPDGGYIEVFTDDGIDEDNPGGPPLNERQGLVDTAGRVIVPLGKWSNVHFAGRGRAVVCEKTAKGSRCGYISLPSGEIVIPAKFRTAGAFSEGFATVKME